MHWVFQNRWGTGLCQAPQADPIYDLHTSWYGRIHHHPSLCLFGGVLDESLPPEVLAGIYPLTKSTQKSSLFPEKQHTVSSSSRLLC